LAGFVEKSQFSKAYTFLKTKFKPQKGILIEAIDMSNYLVQPSVGEWYADTMSFFQARLRHPNILELVEPVEETRNGGLQFATEMVTVSLSGLLQEKDEQERAGGVGGRSSRYVTEDSEGGRKRRELEIDELEIQKGLEQISKALEFLHDNAGLVHGNLTPDAVFVNAKASDPASCASWIVLLGFLQ
jgi:hypothetical protein